MNAIVSQISILQESVANLRAVLVTKERKYVHGYTAGFGAVHRSRYVSSQNLHA